MMMQCSLDGLPFTLCESPMRFTHLQTGEHKFEVQAFSPIGGFAQMLPTLYEWEVALGLDTTPPDTQILKGPPNVSASQIVQLEFTGIDDQTIDLELEFECLLDGILVGYCDSIPATPGVPAVPYELELEEGAYGRHTVQVRAIDEMGNVDPTPATRTWTYVDINSPDTGIIVGPEEETEGTVAIFEFDGEDFHGNMLFDFECSLDGEDFKPCTTPHVVEGLGLGPHVFQVRSVSPSGVVDSTPEWYEWLVIPPLDTDPPDTFIFEPPTISGPDVLLGLQSDELLVEEFECSLDGAQFESCESPGRDHRPDVRPAHARGARDRLLHERRPDARGPHLDRRRRARDDHHLRPARDRRQQERDDRVRVRPGGRDLRVLLQRLASRAVHVAVRRRAAGERHGLRFEVYAVNGYRYLDNEPVQDQSPAVVEWEVQDLEPPDHDDRVGRAARPEDLIEPDTWRFELAGTDNGTVYFELEFECSLDGGPWEGCDTPFHYIPLEELAGGQHTLLVRAMDEFENVDPTPACHLHDRGRAGDDDRRAAPSPRPAHRRRRSPSRPTRPRARRSSARSTSASSSRARTRTRSRCRSASISSSAGQGPAGRGRPRACGLRVAGRRRHAAGDHDPHRPRPGHERHERDLHVHASTIPMRTRSARWTAACRRSASRR